MVVSSEVVALVLDAWIMDDLPGMDYGRSSRYGLWTIFQVWIMDDLPGMDYGRSCYIVIVMLTIPSHDYIIKPKKA